MVNEQTLPSKWLLLEWAKELGQRHQHVEIEGVGSVKDKIIVLLFAYHYW